MINPFFGRQATPLQGRLDPQAVNAVKGMIANLKNVQNPDAVLEKLSGQNPLLGNVMRMIRGRNPRDVFYQECQRCGVNPDEILNMLK